MANRIIIILAALISGVLWMSGATPEEAAREYAAGHYDKAIALYQEFSLKEGTSSELLYNMGQAYTRAGNMGSAMLCYRRALRLDPGNSKARANAEYVESRVQDANRAELKGKKLSITPDEPSFFSSVKIYISERHSSDTWAIWGGVCFVLFCGCVALYVFTRGVMWRKAGFFGGGAMLALSIIFTVFAFMGASASRRHDKGVLTGYKVELRSEPSANAKTVAMPLTQGTEMQVMEQRSDDNGKTTWYKVRLNADYAGWVRNDVFELI